jgi:hypothetical protein
VQDEAKTVTVGGAAKEIRKEVMTLVAIMVIGHPGAQNGMHTMELRM